MPGIIPLRARASLSGVARNTTLRIDAKQSTPSSVLLDKILDERDSFYLNEFLPSPFVKGTQPIYLPDGTEEDGAHVISTLAVRPLSINFSVCRKISAESYDSLLESRKLRDGDVLLTTDGGTSIGKAAVFHFPATNEDDLEIDFTVDSHVAILRPFGMSPTLLTYFLCSPMGQLQFQRAESGASGQTAVSEEDVRRFRFPRRAIELLEAAADKLKTSLEKSRRLEMAAHRRREKAWNDFEDLLVHADGTQTERIRAKIRPSEARFLQLVRR